MLRPRGFIINTAPLRECIQVFQQHLSDAEQSMYCYAPSRYGKTSVLASIERRLREGRVGACLPVHIVNFDERNPSAKFYHALRTGSSEDVRHHAQFGSPRQALLNKIRNDCDKCGTSRVIFLLDEAQGLTLLQYDVLKSLHEELISMDLDPFSLLMAQPELVMRADELRSAQLLRHDLVDRFLTRGHRLRGLKRADFEETCRFYDEARWPESTGLTYTQHFVNELWRDGWRLAAYADRLWGAFELLARSLEVYDDNFEVGTKFMTKAVLRLLTRLSETTETKLYDRAELFHDAALYSEFASHHQSVGDVLTAVEAARRDKALKTLERFTRQQVRSSSKLKLR